MNRELHLAQYGATDLLCARSSPHGKNHGVMRRFGHVRFEAVIAPHDEACPACVAERANSNGPFIGVLVT